MKKLLNLLACTLALPLLATHRDIQLDNDTVKVWKTVITPEAPLSMHRHDKPRIVVGIKGGLLLKVMEDGSTSPLVFESGQAYWFAADPEGELHADVNPSNENIEVLVIEIQ
ncbi:MAG: hypothetical protein KGZ39_03805 [Simkania sp.]|nr:hypothetical protein [Simkania sp.]